MEERQQLQQDEWKINDILATDHIFLLSVFEHGEEAKPYRYSVPALNSWLLSAAVILAE